MVLTDDAPAQPPILRIADATPRLPVVRAQSTPTARPASTPQPDPPAESGSRWYSPFSRVGGWSRANYGITRDLWALGGTGYRAGAVATGIVGTAAAAWADSVGFLFGLPLLVPEPAANAKGDLMGMLRERALHPPEGFADFSTAMRLDTTRYNDTLSYPEMFRLAQQNPELQRELTQVLRAQGIPLPEFAVRSLLNRPELFMRIFAWGPDEVRTGFQHLNRAYQAGQVGGTERDHQLGRHVDLNTFDLSTIRTNRVNPRQVAGPLYYGELPATGDLTAERQNRLWSEVLDRLGSNEHVKNPGERFSVRFGDKTYTSLASFLTDLQASGHQLEVRLRMQGADLPDLSVRNADGSFTKLAVPTFSTIGLRGADGRQALVPWVHFELNVSVRPPADAAAPGPRITGGAAWFQGVSNIGFFPGSVERDSAWTNGRDYVTVRGPAALRTIIDAGLYADTISTSATAQRLRADGYGVFGHCGDSILIGLYGAMQEADRNGDITMDPEFRRRVFATPERSFAFPYMINPAAFRAELERRVADSSRPEAERATYRRLLETVNTVSDDAAPGVLPNPDAARRALDVLELVWPTGQEPFEAVTHAKQTIRDYLARHAAAQR
ncbi:MAG: hypothetical protein ACAI38_04940 [Myxococcota bacterium]